jgi:F-type H+-transporting ATPase subunit epsilon
MANALFSFELVTPSGVVLSRDATYVEVPGDEGRMGVLAGHQPGIVGLSAGLVTARFADTGDLSWSTGPGVMTITPGGVSLLVQTAEAASPKNPAFSLDG